MRIKLTTVHVIASCHDCSWQDDDYLTAQKKALKHAKDKKHIVSVEVGKYGTYHGRKGVALRNT